MLAGCTAALVADGWNVVVPSRRHAPIPANVPAQRQHQQALWVATDWSDPVELADRAARALGGPADLLVAWVHGEYRAGVMKAVAPLLTPDAPVVEVHGSSVIDPQPNLPEHPTQQVVLGLVREGDSTRWLNHKEITDGVLAAVRRAVSGRHPGVFQVGEAPLIVGS